ncbi:CBS domain-containing protein [Streptomyces sp. NPDC017254]|uniref:CBS domain-containing protein n=1 Tax=unclassified Streptomyces TaxID=2593676 RepID=UPI00379F1607
MTVSEAMSHPAVSVPTGTPLRHVAREMAEYGVGSVLVTEGGTLRGIVTDRDLALGALAGGLDANDAVDSLMTSPVVTVGVTDDMRPTGPSEDPGSGVCPYSTVSGSWAC